MDVSKVLRLPGKMQLIFWKLHQSITPATQNDFRHVCRHMRMSWTVTPLTQNHVTTGCETLKQDRFCSFPHRHGEATGKPETRDETMLEHQNEHFVRDFLQFSHFVASKLAFSYGFSCEILWTSKFATSKSTFRARLLSIFSTSHKMPRPQRNLHLVATWRSPNNAVGKKHATRHV